ncbi:MAG: hypothetical protein ACR2PF_05585 [Rhizobiaceae bacterium]
MTKKSSPDKSRKPHVAENPGRRGMLVGTGAVLAGGAAGRATAQQEAPAAPDLPWPWTNIDPMEAGSRTYKAYLEQGG